MSGLCKVLIVDDEMLVRQGIKHHLNWEQEGFQIIGEASNGQEALAQIETLRPHIVITDIVMPIMDGEELTRVVKNKYPEIEVVVLSSFSEFEYVRSTFQNGVADYILKPSIEAQELLRVLQKTAKNIPSLGMTSQPKENNVSIDQMLDRLIAGYDLPPNSTLITKTLPYDTLCLIGCDLKYAKHKDELTIPRIRDHVIAEIESEFTSFTYQVIPTDSSMFVLLVNADNQEINRLRSVAGALSKITKHEPEIYWLLSETFVSLNQLNSVYHDNFLKLIQWRFFVPHLQVMMRNELPNREPSLHKFNLNFFSEEIRRYKFDSAFQYLNEHISSLCGDYETDVFEFKSFLGNIGFNIIILLANMEMDTKQLEATKYDYFKSIDEAKHADEALQQLEAFLAKVNGCIAASHHTADENMNKLLHYIKEHAHEPLTLSDVAKHFYFNPSYLSSYFSTRNKEGFNEYLNRVRVERAAELLRAGTVMISEISGMVGYSDHSYFCKVFKKFTGLSPSQYRKNK